MANSDDPVLFERIGEVLIATINRPGALNALNEEVMELLVGRFVEADRDQSVGCLVIAGSQRAFAAGADIKELKTQNYISMSANKYFSRWDEFAALSTPKIAAVAGYALGGGCELAMMCDFILASESARFGQPEVKLGLMPGMGGTQRLTRLVGRSKAMDLILTGRMMNADEAERCGLVARVVADEDLLGEALEAAERIASYSQHTVRVARDSINRADAMNLLEGVRVERSNYFALFDSPDAIEGMEAFVEKRDPLFNRVAQ